MALEQTQVNAIVDLADSHVTQLTKGHEKSDWLVKTPNGETLGVFPKHFTEDEIFRIMDFAKEFELKALNAGIKEGKQKTVKVYDAKLKEADDRIKYMASENERIAQALENIYMQSVVEE